MHKKKKKMTNFCVSFSHSNRTMTKISRSFSSVSRPFSSGSRQPPDPIDQYLMENGFYRKHTARDSSSLFRVISEQMFDCQNYHEFVRKECVGYMARNKKYFVNSIKGDIDEYLAMMAKPRTHGTLLELRAIANLFQRNVRLFEPFNTGTWFVHDPAFGADESNANEDNFFQLFATVDNHFDTVFTQCYVVSAAFCQALVYEILYSFVYALPDVGYAVERMLHDPVDRPLSTTSFFSFGEYPERIYLADGRTFLLDRPEFTQCILDNHLLCHFHNVHFDRLSAALQNELRECQQTNSDRLVQMNKTMQSLLPEKFTSCVRQLLDEGTN